MSLREEDEVEADAAVGAVARAGEVVQDVEVAQEVHGIHLQGQKLPS